jgi:hypothetical protein
MNKIFKISFILFLVLNCYGFSQRTIEFIPVYGFQTFELNKYYPINKTDSVKIENLKFYISSIRFIKKDVVVFSEEESFHLIDLLNPGTLKLSNLPSDIEFTHLEFNLGIDSITNVSGAMGGDLDPTLGMYWTWQSGYINVKVEGRSNLCRTRLNEFSLHLGGYLSPNLSVRTVTLPVKNTQRIKIYFDVYTFLNAVDLQEQNQIMSPGQSAVSLSGKFADTFICR